MPLFCILDLLKEILMTFVLTNSFIPTGGYEGTGGIYGFSALRTAVGTDAILEGVFWHQ